MINLFPGVFGTVNGSPIGAQCGFCGRSGGRRAKHATAVLEFLKSRIDRSAEETYPLCIEILHAKKTKGPSE